MTAVQVQALVYTMLNLRNADGSLYYNTWQGSDAGLLHAAIHYNDPQIVGYLLDLRTLDGSYAVNINQINSADLTPLDVALQGGVYQFKFLPDDLHDEYRYPLNPEIIDLLLQTNRALTFEDIQAQQAAQDFINRTNYLNIPRITEAEAIDILALFQGLLAGELDLDGNNLAPEERFNANPQNVHSKEVEKTVDHAINALRDRYFKSHQLKINIILREISDFIKQVQKNNIREYKQSDFRCINKGFNFIKGADVKNQIHAPTGLKMIEILALVWIAANDAKALPQEEVEKLKDKKSIDHYLLMRKKALLDQFKEIDTAYIDKPSCLGGARNRLIMALNKAHPDVAIAATRDAAVELVRETAYSLEKELLLKLPYSEQRRILQSWDCLSEIEDPKREQSAAYLFHRDIHKQMVSTIEKFSDLVEMKDIENVISLKREIADEACPYDQLIRPVVHKSLDELLTKIQGIPLSKNTGIQKMNAHIQKYAKEVFDIDQSYEQDYQWLYLRYRYYEAYKKISQLSPDSLKNTLSDIYLQINYSASKNENKIFDLMPNIIKLTDSLAHIEKYAKRFNGEIPREKRAKDATDTLIANLKNKLTQYIIDNDFSIEKTNQYIRQSKADIQQAYFVLSEHRGWKGLLGNCLIALTGIGLFILAAKAIHSYYKDNKATLFFPTSSTKNLDKISQDITRFCR